MEAAPFGVSITFAPGAAATAHEGLQAGDLVFFDADPEDGAAIDHVGMYLGRDERGHRRFISSRKGANGPTLGDVRGASILDGPGLYAKGFRSARRL
jgi:cell wall-associated NlpC family hydrolase